jgi:nucleotide-binding universal stress UspA family protein
MTRLGMTGGERGARSREKHPAMTRYHDILVAVGPLAERSAALECATALALRDRARLTVVAAAGSPPALIWLVPGLPEHPLHALQLTCELRLRSLVASLPAGLSVTSRVSHGRPVPALLDEVRHGPYDLVVVGGEQHRPWRRSLSRRLMGHPVSILVVTPERAAAPRHAVPGDDLVSHGPPARAVVPAAVAWPSPSASSLPRTGPRDGA